MTNDDHGNFTLSTGRTFCANRGLISVGEGDFKPWELYAGYDNSLGTGEWDDVRDEPADFTDDEKREIADFMIERWTRFRETLAQTTGGAQDGRDDGGTGP